MMPFALFGHLEIANSRVAIKILDHSRRQIRYFKNPQIRKPVGENESDICVFFGLHSTLYTLQSTLNVEKIFLTHRFHSALLLFSQSLLLPVNSIYVYGLRAHSFISLCYSLSYAFSNSYSFIFLSLNFQLRS